MRCFLRLRVQLIVDILVKGPLDGSYTPLNVVLFVFGIVSSATLYIRTRYVPQLDSAQLASHAIMEEDEEGL